MHFFFFYSCNIFPCVIYTPEITALMQLFFINLAIDEDIHVPKIKGLCQHPRFYGLVADNASSLSDCIYVQLRLRNPRLQVRKQPRLCVLITGCFFLFSSL